MISWQYESFCFLYVAFLPVMSVFKLNLILLVLFPSLLWVDPTLPSLSLLNAVFSVSFSCLRCGSKAFLNLMWHLWYHLNFLPMSNLPLHTVKAVRAHSVSDLSSVSNACIYRHLPVNDSNLFLKIR